jgi:diguanylate cyclase (GGDEF)-like protein/PAS domain S-box-containing protein
MEARNNLLVAALEAAANSIIITDKDANIIWINSAFTRLSGYSAEEAIGRNPKTLIKSQIHDKAFYQAMWADILEGKHWRGELINKRKDGSLYHEELSIAPVKDKTGEITHFIGIKDDISQRKQLEEQLQKMANTDPLTELFNRRVLLEHLAQETARLARFENQSAALLMLDLDYFKRINDTYGHSTGDEVLRKFADIVRQTSRAIDLPARLGGEEFAILLPGATKIDAMSMAERLRQQVANTVIPHKKGSVRITVSIGAASLSADDVAGDEVLSHADAALYKAKDAGRNQCCWFDVNHSKSRP